MLPVPLLPSEDRERFLWHYISLGADGERRLLPLAWEQQPLKATTRHTKILGCWNHLKLPIFGHLEPTKWQFCIDWNRQIHLHRLKNASENALGHATLKLGQWAGSLRGRAWQAAHTENRRTSASPTFKLHSCQKKKKDCFQKAPQPKRNK